MRKPLQIFLVVALVLLAAAAAVLFGQYRTTTTELTRTQASEQRARDRYGETIDAIAEIQDSLNAIALGDTGVGMHPWNPQTGSEPSSPKGREALDRIAVLRASISRSKDRIQHLEAGLRQSGMKVVGLQRMIANLKRTVVEKEDLVARLGSRVDSLQTQVTSLATTVEETQSTLRERERTIEERRRELATVYYVVGSKKDLKHAGVVQSKGGVLGIGKTLQPAPVLDETTFTPLDTDQNDVIRTPAAKARVLSAQPVASYEMRLVDGRMELHILDPAAFRKIKQVVILTS